ncbi:hypothetical protein AYI68_g191 [Smittium mucronatum]|uniref:Uncharacterized protein n=1 Tax=Smittium mucronatum TaxID=133383 RepID=A0A1R0H8U1_9FUNG|nr:hypothetical protein AYI68_g191 [Smittium mucronatum]
MEIKASLVCMEPPPLCELENIAEINIKEKNTHEISIKTYRETERSQRYSMYHVIHLTINEEHKLKVGKNLNLYNNGTPTPQR